MESNFTILGNDIAYIQSGNVVAGIEKAKEVSKEFAYNRVFENIKRLAEHLEINNRLLEKYFNKFQFPEKINPEIFVLAIDFIDQNYSFEEMVERFDGISNTKVLFRESYRFFHWQEFSVEEREDEDVMTYEKALKIMQGLNIYMKQMKK